MQWQKSKNSIMLIFFNINSEVIPETGSTHSGNVKLNHFDITHWNNPNCTGLTKRLNARGGAVLALTAYTSVGL